MKWIKLTVLQFFKEISYWTLDVSRTGSYEISVVRLSVFPSVRQSVTKFSQDWIISFS